MTSSSTQINTDGKGNITTSIEINEEGKTLGYVTIMTKDIDLNTHIEKAVNNCIKKYESRK